ncbi:flagellar biosynthesis repressor FlbT [Novispirillum sp. DQ9]|uniref:flagellar biosynthesis repressor FlbT n=1 Tax=Novispirillum sp. DQ9 TaxID=3398612 RepID=UPI003C7C2A99
MALKIKLKPHEKAIINGAVIQNGPRAAEFIVKNFAQILREPEVMQEQDATTPAKRTYFSAQLMLLDPENVERYRPVFDGFLKDLKGALTNPEMLAKLATAGEAVAQNNYYQALRQLRDVIEYESVLLGALSPTVATTPPQGDDSAAHGDDTPSKG